jgi:hypothetical protein
VGVYIGSLDDENSATINFKNGTSHTYSGDNEAAVSGQSTPIPGGNPTIHGALTNGRWTFTDPSADIVGITIFNGTAIPRNSFEIAQITTSFVPEPPTLVMLLGGFAFLGFVSFSQTRKTSRSLA